MRQICLKAFLPVLLNLLSRESRAQDFERLVQEPPMERNGERLEFPFLGGLDRFMPQLVDSDGGGDFDLFLLRPFAAAQGGRLEGRLTFLENAGDAQNFRFRFVTDFYGSLDAHNWFFFLDFDRDGDYDLMHDNGERGLAYRRNTGSARQPQFTLITTAVTGASGDTVRNEFTSFPAFADLDGDGDADFFSGLAIGTIAFYRNAGNAAMPVFDFVTNRWQDLIILSLNAAGSSSFQISSPVEAKHGANAVTFTDLDRDGDQDFFYGDFFHRSVYHLHNSGDALTPAIAVTDTFWPPPQPVRTLGYNVPSFADLDGDGDVDFFAAVLNQDRDNFLFYLNLGNSSLRPSQNQWQQTTANFLSIIDVGGAATPAFADLDADGDQDLFLGNLEGRIVHYENIGTIHRPAWQWRTDAFQNIRVNSFSSSPTFVDIDHDADTDLFVGSFSGTFAFFENMGTPQSPNFALRTATFENIDVGSAGAPHFADYDRDGDYDLFAGEIDAGTISIFENAGHAASGRFQFKTEIRHPITATDSKPFLWDWNSDGILDLFAGQRNGRIIHYRGAANASGVDFIFESPEFAGLHVGESSTPAFADLNGDGRVDLIAGDEAGGLYYFEGRKDLAVETISAAPASFMLEVFPNPFHDDLQVALLRNPSAGFTPPQITIYNIAGARLVQIEPQYNGNDSWMARWSPEHLSLAAGVYFVHVQWGSLQARRKILLLK